MAGEMLLNAEEARLRGALLDRAGRLWCLAEIALLAIFLERHGRRLRRVAAQSIELTREHEEHEAGAHRERGHRDEQVRYGHGLVEPRRAAAKKIAYRCPE